MKNKISKWKTSQPLINYGRTAAPEPSKILRRCPFLLSQRHSCHNLPAEGLSLVKPGHPCRSLACKCQSARSNEEEGWTMKMCSSESFAPHQGTNDSLGMTCMDLLLKGFLYFSLDWVLLDLFKTSESFSSPELGLGLFLASFEVRIALRVEIN